jgi:large subunit ribosomal protein L25
MERIILHAGLRTALTKGERNQIRREGGVPAILYGKSVDPTPIYITPEAFKNLAHQNGYGLVELQIDGKGTYTAMVHKIEREPVSKRVLHIDFHAVQLNEPVDVDVPIVLVGLEQVEKRGGVVQQQMREVMLRALPADVPEHVPADISSLEIGQTLLVGQLPIPERCELKSDPDQVVLSVIVPKNAPPELEIEPKEPELVHDTEGKGEEAYV